MITEAMQHCPGIGPVRLKGLRASGVQSWLDVLKHGDRLPAGQRQVLTEESLRCLQALRSSDVRYFVERFVPQDRWRILGQFFERTSFFDIETTGLEQDATITMIVCWHRGQLRTFVEHENLDDFLSLLDEVFLLASFNGSSFDVPRVLDTFHIPELPCPHIDLRWSCHHRGLRGTLKDIASRMGIIRPAGLQEIDGARAVRLWHEWTSKEDRVARDQLIQYCAADVLMLVMIAHHLVGSAFAASDYWGHLSQRDVPVSLGAKSESNVPFGAASPARIRASWRRAAG